jgi:hypothetical protein
MSIRERLHPLLAHKVHVLYKKSSLALTLDLLFLWLLVACPHSGQGNDVALTIFHFDPFEIGCRAWGFVSRDADARVANMCGGLTAALSTWLCTAVGTT